MSDQNQIGVAAGVLISRLLTTYQPLVVYRAGRNDGSECWGYPCTASEVQVQGA